MTTAFTTLTGRAVVLPADDVDTDQIIPARFLKGTSKTGLGDHLFADWRTRPNFPLLAPEAVGAQVLVTGVNFGCGSSREHAPWALLDFGIRCVIASSYSDIFYSNCFKNGILPIVLPQEQVDQLMKEAQDVRSVKVAFVKGEEQIADPAERNVQRPRVFYRRELETQPLVIAKP